MMGTDNVCQRKQFLSPSKMMINKGLQSHRGHLVSVLMKTNILRSKGERDRRREGGGESQKIDVGSASLKLSDRNLKVLSLS